MAADDPTVLTDWNALAVTTLIGDTTRMGTETILARTATRRPGQAPRHRLRHRAA
jgi:hypothetical protein